MDSVSRVNLLVGGRKEERGLSRNVVPVDGALGRPPRDRGGVVMSGAGSVREEDTVTGKRLDGFLGVKRQKDTVAVRRGDGWNEIRCGARSTDRRV